VLGLFVARSVEAAAEAAPMADTASKRRATYIFRTSGP